MKEKKKNVPPVTEKKPDQFKQTQKVEVGSPDESRGEPVKMVESPQTGIPKDKSAPVVPKAVSPIQIPPKVLEQAKALGIDLKQVVDWAQGVEQKFAVIEKNFEQIGGFLQKMEPLVKLSEQISQRQANPQPTAAATGGFDMGSIMQLLPSILGSGSNPMQEKMDRFTGIVLDRAIENTLNPPKPLIQKYLEEETAKKIAKQLAESST